MNSSPQTGTAVVSNRIVSSVATNLCTQYTGEGCYFGGGQIVKFSDDSVLILGIWLFGYNVSGDTDTDQNSITAFFPSTVSASYMRVSTFVARGAGYKNLYLVYQRSPELLPLVHDTNGSATVDAGDTTLATLSITSW